MELRRLVVLVVAATTIMGVAEASPLEVTIRELVNTTINMDWQNGNYIQTYKTNVTGFLNITNKGNDDIYDVWVAVNLTNVTGAPIVFYKSDSNINVEIIPKTSFTPPSKLVGNFNYTNSNYIIHITYLKPSDIVSIFYDVEDSGIDEGSPFIVDESYNVSKIPANRIVTWKVFMNISLNETWFGNTAIDQPSLTLNVTKYLSNQTNNFGSDSWIYLNLSGDVQTNKSSAQKFDSPYTAGTDQNAFKIPNILLNTTSDENKYINITFNVTGKNTMTSVKRLESFGFATFEFKFASGQNVSGSYVIDVFAIGNVTLSVNKRGPYQNDTGEYALWIGNATVNNTASGLAYVVTNTTLWATQQRTFSGVINDEYDGNPAILTETPMVTIFPWGTLTPNSYTTSDLKFNYSDVPVIWADCTFKIIHNTSYGWWSYATTTNATYGSGYIVIEKIYVIGTYLIKVTKHVIPNSSNVYDIYLVVENVGPERSPELYVYDMIPINFTPYNWNNTWKDPEDDGNWVNQSSMLINNGSTSNPTTGYSLGLWWQLHGLNGTADGDGNYEDWSEISNNQSVVIFYQVQGVGNYTLIDAFIVGVDPTFSINPQTAHKITIVGGAKATSFESLMALICGAMFLGIIVKRRR